MPLGLGAVLGIVGAQTGIGVFQSWLQSRASKRSARAQRGAIESSTELQMEFLRETRADIAAAVEAGMIDLEAGFSTAIKLLEDPSAVMKRPGVQFQFEQGTEALQAGFSRASGGGVSGRALKAVTEYGQNFASLALDKELARLRPMQELGMAKANLRIGGATGMAGMTGRMAPGIAQGVMQQGNVAAGNIINQANIQSGLLSNISNQATDWAALYAVRPDLFGGGNTNVAATKPQLYGRGGR